MRRPPSLMLFAMFIAISVAGAESARWDVETILRQDMAGEFAVSPDGKRAVWVKRHLDEKGKRYNWDLFLSELEPGKTGPKEPLRLTRHEARDGSPRWSPDGGRIAFLSERGEEKLPQVWLLELRGGEARALTESPDGIGDFRWRDAGHLVLLSGEGKTLRRIELEEAKDESVVVGDEEHLPPSRLFSLEIDSGKLRRLTSNRMPILDFELSPDGRWALARHSRDLHFDYDFRNPPSVMLWDLETGDSREILAPSLLASGFAWDLKSEGFYYHRPVASDSTDLFVSLDLLGYYELKSDRAEAVDLQWERGISYGGIHVSDRGLLVDLFDGTRNRLMHLERKGRGKVKRRLLPAPERGIVAPLALGPDGETLIYGRTNSSDPMRFFAAKLGKSDFKGEREFLRLNEFLDELPHPRSETIRWAGAQGDSVEGMLHYPLDYREGERHPLVVMVHGGPSDADRDFFLESWGGSPALMCSRGAFVLRPNYHGSGGYGLAWLESIKGRYYEFEVQDILAGVDHLVDLGLADESRLGIQGWSNGAILAIAVCIESGERFRVLDAGAGDVNWTSDYGNCSFGAAFDNAYIGGPPWRMPQSYVDMSPIFRIDELKVPTIIFFGTEDRTVPTEQGWQLYRGMQQVGAAPVRFVLFPGEDHSLMNPVHRRRQLEEEMAWFDRHLFDGHEARNEAFKPGSPLDRALRLADVARVDGIYGENLEGRLIPELVTRDSLLVGRFEVTRAQWAAYRHEVPAADAPSDSDVEGSVGPGSLPGELDSPAWPADPEGAAGGNLPATDMDFEAAADYCRWLSDLTGLSCRLPSVAELEALVKLSEDEENTLAWWAGYEAKVDDLARLAEKVEELEANRVLLFPVGSFAPAGETGLYDLNGNAAEWASSSDGGGAARGLSALTAPDPAGEASVPPPAYIGFRVVAGAAEKPEADEPAH